MSNPRTVEELLAELESATADYRLLWPEPLQLSANLKLATELAEHLISALARVQDESRPVPRS